MVRVGIVGTNWITDKFLEAAKLVENFELSAVYSRTRERAEEVAEKYNVEMIFTNLEEMAASSIIDAVYIATPNAFHAEQSILFLRNNKHVLCEKPLAANASEVKKMFETAKEHDVLLMEAMKSTLIPNFMAIQNNLHKIGRI
ncbi:NAD(P)-binding protein, partial [Rhizophagus irregularis]